MNVALFLLAIPICIADLKGFVIPNIYNTILLYVALIHLSFYGFGDLRDVLISAVILIGLALLRTGMGDIKTLSLILMTHTAGSVESRTIGKVELVAKREASSCISATPSLPT